MIIRKKKLLCFLASCVLQLGMCNFVRSQVGQNLRGSCYVKCNIISKKDTVYKKYYVLKEDTLIKNIKLKTDPIYLNLDNYNKVVAYKNDEEKPIWVLSDEDLTIKYIHYLSRRSRKKVNPELIDTIYIEKVIGGVFQEWRRTKCSNSIDLDYIKNIEEKLVNIGYMDAKHETSTSIKMELKISDELEAALIRFQKDSNLCYGQLTMETLELLGIN